MDIYAVKFWAGKAAIIYKLERWRGDLKWIIALETPRRRTYIDLGTSPEPYQWIIDFEPSHLSLELVSPL